MGKTINRVQIINDFLLLEAISILTMFTLLVPSSMTRYEMGWWLISVVGVQLVYNYFLHIVPATFRHFWMIVLRLKNIIVNQLENWEIDREHNLERVSHQGLKDIKTQIKRLNKKQLVEGRRMDKLEKRKIYTGKKALIKQLEKMEGP